MSSEQMIEQEKPKNLGGRPSKYSLELAQKICKKIATCTDSLAKICASDPDFPTRETIYAWRLDHKGFSDMYADSKRAQAELLVEEIIEISDNTYNDTIVRVNKDGSESESCNHEWVARSRLKVDTRKWIACKLLPKVYGEKIDSDSKEDAKSLMQKLIDKL
jgi:hypothetical protein